MKTDLKKTFEEIYNNESDAIFRFCSFKVSDREQALDITQETFLRLWNNMLEEKEIQNKKAFLFTVARHLVIDWYRKKKSLSLDAMTQNGGDTAYDPPDEKSEGNTEIGAEGRYLIEKINDLNPTYRTPVYLRFVEDLSPGEIGKILGISANSASVRINRGLFELRKKTGYYNKDDERE